MFLNSKAWGLGLLGRQRVREGNGSGRIWYFVSGTVFALCLATLALFHVWLRLQVVRLGYVLSTTSKLQHQLEQENRELELELATATSPERLEREARQRLGLREPKKNQVVDLP